jgi:hypothetical protein
VSKLNSIFLAIFLVATTSNARYDKQDCYCDCEDYEESSENDDDEVASDLTCQQTYNGQNFISAITSKANNGIGWSPAYCLYSNNEMYEIRGYIAPKSGPWTEPTYGHFTCSYFPAAMCVMSPL